MTEQSTLPAASFEPSLDALVNLEDVERLAAAALDPATFAFVAGGAGAELTLARNRAAFAEWCLLPRAFADVSEVSTATEVLGESISMPVLVAPMGLQRIVHREGECEMARGVARTGTIMCVSTVSTRSPEEIAQTGVRRWFQLYPFRDEGLTRHLVAQAREHGYGAIVLTADGAVVARRERALRAGFAFGPDIAIPSCGEWFGSPAGADPAMLNGEMTRSLTWDAVGELAASAGLPLVVKGLLSPEDARLACEHGAAAVIVSNHGGRQLDGAPATLSALPGIVEAVRGRAQVLLDGGVRRGVDVLVALALGATAVLLGRPAYWGLAAGGADGVSATLELLRAEIEQALILLGCGSPGEVARERVIAEQTLREASWGRR
ncbi:MAG: alpha-hydroxy acid oxidase [Solirubrobacteraceae bacterium]